MQNKIDNLLGFYAEFGENYSNDQKKDLYAALKKTADRRLRRLRENDKTVPIRTKNYLDIQQKKQFPSVTSVDNSYKINQALNEVVKFLQNDESTLSGLKKATAAPKEKKGKTQLLTETFRDYGSRMNLTDKKEIYGQLKKTADRRLRRLRESNNNLPIETDSYLKRIKKRNFPSINEKSKEWEVNEALQEIVNFLENDQSTLTGLHSITTQIVREVEKRLNMGRSEENKIRFSDKDIRKIYNFTHTKQFRRLRNDIGSDLTLEDFQNALKEGDNPDTIMDYYEKYIAGELSFTQMQHLRESARRQRNENNKK